MTIRKGMILAAGLGTRLLPITKEIPKPLVPVLNIPNVLHTIDLFQRVGITDIILNLFHLSDVMENYFKNHPVSGVKISFSKEKTLMGTGGGVKLAESFFAGEPFILSNCDFVTDIDLSTIIATHQKRNALATMVLLNDPRRIAEYSAVGVASDSRLCKMPKYTSQKPDREGIFTGIHILEAETLKHLKPEPCGINDVLYPTLMQKNEGRVFGEFATDCYWYDTGDVPKFLDSSLSLLSHLKGGDKILSALFKRQKIDPMLLDPLALLGENVDINSTARIGEGVVVGSNSKIGPKTSLARCILLSGSEVPPGTVLEDLIYFRGNSLPAKSPA